MPPDSPTLWPAHTLSITLACGPDRVGAFLAEPLNYPRWASGLATGLQPCTDELGWWRADAPQGEARIRFTPANVHGVADHWVRLPDGSEVYVPLRVVANGVGSEVLLTLFRLPGMDDAQWAADQQWVMWDLGALKRLLESAPIPAASHQAPRGG